MTILRWLLSQDRYEAFEGDVREDFAYRARLVGARRARWRSRREVVLMIVHVAGPWIVAAVAVGLATASPLPVVGLDGGLFFTLLVATLLLPLAWFRWRPAETWLLRFLVAFVTVMTFILVLYVVMAGRVAAPLSLWGHTWRMAFLVALVGPYSACAALMSPGRSRSPYVVPLGLALLGFGALWLVGLPVTRVYSFAGRIALMLSVAATVLLATASFLRNQRIQPFARRFLIVLGVQVVMALLLCGLPFALMPVARAARVSAFSWFQSGALPVEMVLVSVAIAMLTRVREPADPDDATHVDRMLA